MITGAELKRVWVDTVRLLLATDDYHVGGRYNKVFDRAAETINAGHLDPERFCQVQVRFAMECSIVIYPTLLVGKAVARYHAAPSDRETRGVLKDVLDGNKLLFKQLYDNRGLEYALNNQTFEYAPIFQCYMHWKLDREWDNQQARLQLAAEPLWTHFFPEDFISTLETHNAGQ